MMVDWWWFEFVDGRRRKREDDFTDKRERGVFVCSVMFGVYDNASPLFLSLLVFIP